MEASNTFEKIISENNVSSARKYIKKLSTSYKRERLVLLSSFAHRKRNIAISNGISNDNVAIVYGLFCDLIQKTIKTNCRTEQRCVFALMETIVNFNLYHKVCFAGKGLSEKEFLKSFFSEDNSSIADNFTTEQRALMVSKIDSFLTENDCKIFINHLNIISLSLQKETK